METKFGGFKKRGVADAEEEVSRTSGKACVSGSTRTSGGKRGGGAGAGIGHGKKRSGRGRSRSPLQQQTPSKKSGHSTRSKTPTSVKKAVPARSAAAHTADSLVDLDQSDEQGKRTPGRRFKAVELNAEACLWAIDGGKLGRSLEPAPSCYCYCVISLS